jgi:hypothetical protein
MYLPDFEKLTGGWKLKTAGFKIFETKKDKCCIYRQLSMQKSFS